MKEPKKHKSTTKTTTCKFFVVFFLIVFLLITNIYFLLHKNNEVDNNELDQINHNEGMTESIVKKQQSNNQKFLIEKQKEIVSESSISETVNNGHSNKILLKETKYKIFHPDGTKYDIDIFLQENVAPGGTADNVYRFSDHTLVKLRDNYYNKKSSWGGFQKLAFLNSDCTGQAYAINNYNIDEFNQIIEVPGGFMKPTGFEKRLSASDAYTLNQDHKCKKLVGTFDLLPLIPNYTLPNGVSNVVEENSYWTDDY